MDFSIYIEVEYICAASQATTVDFCYISFSRLPIPFPAFVYDSHGIGYQCGDSRIGIKAVSDDDIASVNGDMIVDDTLL